MRKMKRMTYQQWETLTPEQQSLTSESNLPEIPQEELENGLTMSKMIIQDNQRVWEIQVEGQENTTIYPEYKQKDVAGVPVWYKFNPMWGYYYSMNLTGMESSMDKNPDGNISQDETAVEIPSLVNVPIPNFQIDEVNVTFDMEVKNNERSDNSTSMGASLSGGAKFEPINLSVIRSVSPASSNTRCSDRSAKYHISVFAEDHGTPEGLARVLEMMAASVTPSLLSSRAVDSNGNELRGKDKERFF
jgi:hypothetical protein